MKYLMCIYSYIVLTYHTTLTSLYIPKNLLSTRIFGADGKTNTCIGEVSEEREVTQFVLKMVVLWLSYFTYLSYCKRLLTYERQEAGR